MTLGFSANPMVEFLRNPSDVYPTQVRRVDVTKKPQLVWVLSPWFVPSSIEVRRTRWYVMVGHLLVVLCGYNGKTFHKVSSNVDCTIYQLEPLGRMRPSRGMPVIYTS